MSEHDQGDEGWTAEEGDRYDEMDARARAEYLRQGGGCCVPDCGQRALVFCEFCEEPICFDHAVSDKPSPNVALQEQGTTSLDVAFFCPEHVRYSIGITR